MPLRLDREETRREPSGPRGASLPTFPASNLRLLGLQTGLGSVRGSFLLTTLHPSVAPKPQ